MRRTFVAAVAVASLGLVVACTATPEPPTVGDDGKTSTPGPGATSASPTPTVPVTDFVRQYVDAANTGLTSGDVAGMRALANESCDFCTQTAASIERFHANGGSYVGDATWHITEVGKPSGTDPVKLSMYVQVKPHSTVAKKGATPKPDKGRTLLFDVTLGKEDGQWKVKDLVVNGGRM